MFRNPRDGPDLSVMGVTTELEVYLLVLCLVQVVRLVVEQDTVFRAVSLFHQHTQRIPAEVTAVIASNEAEVANGDTGVLQQADAGILVELPSPGLSAVIFMVTDACIDGCLQPPELLVHSLFEQRAHATVDDIAGNEDYVRMFSID